MEKHPNSVSNEELWAHAYASVRRAIWDYVVDNGRVTKMATTKAQRKAVANIRKARVSSRPLSLEEKIDLAEKLGINVRDVELAEHYVFGSDDSIEFEATASGKHSDPVMADEFPVYYRLKGIGHLLNEKTAREAAFYFAWGSISDRERDIIGDRKLSMNKTTLRVMSDKFGISMPRITQIEQSATRKLADFIQSWMARHEI
jgi:RNA polymerase sigma-32 factor